MVVDADAVAVCGEDECGEGGDGEGGGEVGAGFNYRIIKQVRFMGLATERPTNANKLLSIDDVGCNIEVSGIDHNELRTHSSVESHTGANAMYHE
jgi:hypothetical protein